MRPIPVPPRPHGLTGKLLQCAHPLLLLLGMVLLPWAAAQAQEPADFDLDLVLQSADQTPAVAHGVIVTYRSGNVRFSEYQRTDEAGRITIKTVRKRCQDRLPAGVSLASDAELTIASDLPLPAGHEVTFRLAQPPTSEIVMVLPVMGRLTVTLSHPRFLPLLPSARVYLRVFTEQDEQTPSRLWQHAERELRATQGPGRPAEFKVAVGGRYVVQARLQGHEELFAVVEGPEAADSPRILDIPLHEACVVKARVKDPDGRLLARQNLQIQLTAANGASVGYEVATDAEGVFIAALRAHGEAGWTARIQQELHQAVFALPEPLVAGAVDAGVIMLERDPLLLAGRVVDRTGRNVFQPRVQVERQIGDLWLKDPGLRVDVDRTGRFTVSGVVPEGALRLLAQRPGFRQQEPLPAVRGATDHQIVLEADGRIHGSVLADPAILAAGLLTLQWFEQGAPMPDPGVPGLGTTVDPRGRFQIGALAPGRHGVTVYLAGRLPLVTVKDVEVSPGRTPLDPRLTDLDLRHLQPVRIAVQDEKGNALPAHVQLVQEGLPLGEPIPLERTREGTTLLARGADPITVCVLADDCLAVFLEAVEGDRTVVPNAAPKVPVRLTLDGGEWPADLAAEVTFTPRNVAPMPDASQLTAMADFPAGSGGRALVRPRLLGAHGVSVRVAGAVLPLGAVDQEFTATDLSPRQVSVSRQDLDRVLPERGRSPR